MIEIIPRISFATHQCDFPVLAALVARNNTDAVAEGIALRLDVRPPAFAPRFWAIDRIEAGAETCVRDRRVSLAGGLLDGLTERMRADVMVELLREDEVLAREKRTIHALARNEWGGAGALLHAVDVFVCSSRVERLGNMAIEAWSAGCPLAAAANGLAELVRDGQDGLVVPRENATALATGAR